MRLKTLRQERLRRREADTPRSLFVSGGIGDVLALSCFVPLPDNLETIYYASRKVDELQAFFSLLTTSHTKHVSLWNDWSSRFAFYSLGEFVRTTRAGEDIAAAADWSIASLFPRIQPDEFRGFPWLAGHPLSSVHDVALPERYAVLVPYSTDKRDSRRDLTKDEIGQIVDWAADRVPLVLLNRGADVPAVDAPHVIDLNNKTTLLEAIAITSRAVGYFGIDSSMSVVATKHLPADRLAIKTVNPHCLRWQHVYFAPHTACDFLTEDVVGRLKDLSWTE